LKSLPARIGIAVGITLPLIGVTGAHAQVPCPQWSDCLAVNQPDGSTFEVLVSEVTETQSGSQSVYTIPVFAAPIDPSEFDKAIVLTDSSGYSDIVGIAQIGSAAPALGFSSDAEGTPLVWDSSVGGAGPAAVIPEPGVPINVSEFLAPGLVALGWSAVFQSDVPEPSTWAMMLLGFAGIGWVGYRRGLRKVSVAVVAA
jgi:hypothetical protein